MTIVFVILIILAAVVLGLIVLIQNPKGGGLTGNIAGLSNQFMGVKQTTDVLEKGTWIFAAVIGVLCLLSVAFTSAKPGTASNSATEGNTNFPMPSQKPAPAPQTTVPTAPATQPGATTPGTTAPATNNAKPAGQ
jgi:preprotein translocase subunit SecG